MPLLTSIYNHFNLKKTFYYNLAHSYYNACDKSDLEITPSFVRNKCISILLDHEFIHTPCIQIELSLFIQDGLLHVGTYTIYINEIDNNIIDEFLSIL
jgi:hypothetical protein